MHTTGRGELGRAGEDLAVVFLEGKGMEVLERNWRDGPRGELDIVARDPVDRTLVFVEVRTRRGTLHGTALESVDARKLARLRRLVSAWLAAHDQHGRVRLDVIAVQVEAGDGAGAHVTWLRGIGS